MKKKNILIAAIIVIAIAIVGVVYLILNTSDKESTLTLLEKQWIESNKNKVIDFGMVNEIPVLNYSGEGVVYDFIKQLGSTTGLEINKISFSYDEKTSEEYSFRIVPKVGKNDILVYSDNYVLLSKKHQKFNNINEISGYTVGATKNYLDSVATYLTSTNMTYKPFDSNVDMLRALTEDIKDLDYIVVPKLYYFSKMSEYKDLYINYNLTEMKDNYVVRLGKNKRLNSIITKYYKKWNAESYSSAYNKNFTNSYFTFNSKDDQTKTKLMSKRYIYGFVENAPFDLLSDEKLRGINSAIIKDFAAIADVEVGFETYKDVESLKRAFNANEIDFFFDKYSNTNYDMDIKDSVSSFDENIAVISKYDNNIVVNSFASLADNNVIALANTKIEEQLKKNGIKPKIYNTMQAIFKNMSEKDVVVVDLVTYNFYRNNEFKTYKLDATLMLNDSYAYKIRSVTNNKIFADFFDFYLSFIGEKSLISAGVIDAEAVVLAEETSRKTIFIGIAVGILIVTFFMGSILIPKKDKTNSKMKKDDKLRYIDMLTSLKNRNYLNDNIEKWDSSEVYPQAIVIIDLNNVAYINDNYGHQEGDNLIKEAANILITTQVPNSDIIRTNGNEFLIYLVGYDEKQVIAYSKKIVKELKDLSHGFGAAIGYSMITDAIKTIDDAVNEATLDMRNNKEEITS